MSSYYDIRYTNWVYFSILQWQKRLSSTLLVKLLLQRFLWWIMPIPSASSKIIFTTFKFFWACSIFFEHSQIFWSWSKARFYLINFHIWAWSKIFEHIQKILNTVKNIWTRSKNIWTSRWIRHKLSKMLMTKHVHLNW